MKNKDLTSNNSTVQNVKQDGKTKSLILQTTLRYNAA